MKYKRRNELQTPQWSTNAPTAQNAPHCATRTYLQFSSPLHHWMICLGWKIRQWNLWQSFALSCNRWTQWNPNHRGKAPDRSFHCRRRIGGGSRRRRRQGATQDGKATLLQKAKDGKGSRNVMTVQTVGWQDGSWERRRMKRQPESENIAAAVLKSYETNPRERNRNLEINGTHEDYIYYTNEFFQESHPPCSEICTDDNLSKFHQSGSFCYSFCCFQTMVCYCSLWQGFVPVHLCLCCGGPRRRGIKIERTTCWHRNVFNIRIYQPRVGESSSLRNQNDSTGKCLGGSTFTHPKKKKRSIVSCTL